MGLNEPQSLLSLHTFFEIRWISNFNLDVQWTVWLLTLSWKIREFLANQTALESHKGKGPMTLQIFIFRPQFETVFKGIFLPGPSPSSKSQWFVLNFLCQWTMNQEVPCLFCFIAQNNLPGPCQDLLCRVSQVRSFLVSADQKNSFVLSWGFIFHILLHY